MDVIETKGLSKDYGHGRGIFDVTFEVHKGEVYGFLGPNGSREIYYDAPSYGFLQAKKRRRIYRRERLLEGSCRYHEIGWISSR